MPFFMSPLKPGCIFEVDAIMEVTIQRRARRCRRGGSAVVSWRGWIFFGVFLLLLLEIPVASRFRP